MIDRKVVAIASAGGHWIQLLRLRQAWAETSITYITTPLAPTRDLDGKVFLVRDANESSKFHLFIVFVQMIWILARVRPDIVVSTGAAPGLMGIIAGRIFGAKCLWVDSVANSEELSKSGRFAKRICHVVLSQWEDVAERNQVEFWGRVF